MECLQKFRPQWLVVFGVAARMIIFDDNMSFSLNYSSTFINLCYGEAMDSRDEAVVRSKSNVNMARLNFE